MARLTREQEIALGNEALEAMRRAVRRVWREHRKSGLPLYILKDGRVTKVILRPKQPPKYVVCRKPSPARLAKGRRAR